MGRECDENTRDRSEFMLTCFDFFFFFKEKG